MAPDLWTPCGGLWSCGDRCVNVLSDPNNCGMCGTACGDASCQNGRCVTNGNPLRLTKFTGERFSCGCQGPVELAIGDVDGDGRLDVVTANEGSQDVSVLRNIGDGRLGAAELSPGVSLPTGLVLAELNGRFSVGLDAAVVARSGRVFILRNDGGRLVNAQTGFEAQNTEVTSVVAANMNGDIGMDLVLSGTDSLVEIHYGDDSTNFDGLFPIQAMATAPVVSLAAADLNADGNLDLVALTANGFEPFVRTGAMTYQRLPSIAASSRPIHRGLQLLDFDGDRRLDLFSCGALHLSYTSGRANDGSGLPQFSTPSWQAPPGAPLTHDGFAMGKLRFDDNVDLIIASEKERVVRVFAGAGSAFLNWTNPNRYEVPGPRALTLADMNGDGALDIVTVNPGDNSVTVLLDSIK